MKRTMLFIKKSLLILFLFLCSDIFSQEWECVNPLPTNDDIFGIKYFNKDSGLIITYKGIIFKTTDGGNKWRKIKSPGITSTYYFNFIDINTFCYFANADISGIILMYITNDGGYHWAKKNINLSYPSVIYSFECYDGNNMFMSIDNGKVIKTTDGGDTWTMVYSDSTANISSIYISDPGTVIISKNKIVNGIRTGSILKTTDGGNTWNQVFSAHCVLNKIDFKDRYNGWVNFIFDYDTIGCGILYTNNSGESWDIESNLPFLKIDNVSFVNDTGYAFFHPDNLNKALYKTTDNGQQWNVVHGGDVFNFDIWDFDVLDGNNLIAIGRYGFILKSSDGGIAWTNLQKGTRRQLNVSYFIKNVGYIGGDSIMLKSHDNGLTWNEINHPDSTNVRGLYFKDTTNGYLWSDFAIYKTVNGAASWSKIKETHGYGGIISFQLASPTKFYILLSSGCYFWSSDAGTTWYFNTSFNNIDNHCSMYFVSSDTGFISVGELLYKTNDGGLSWYQIYNYGYFIDKITFIDNMNGFLAGHGLLQKTTDGGITWTSLFVGNNVNGIDFVYFENKNHGFVNANNETYETYDGGMIWKKISYYYTVAGDIPINSRDELFLYGYMGTILKRTRQNSIEGNVFNDINNNNVRDNGEPPVTDVLIRSISGDLDQENITSTDNLGNYNVLSDSGSYTCSVGEQVLYFNSNPLNYGGNFHGLTDIDSNRNFAIHFIPNVKDLELIITPLTTLVRPGFDAIYIITYRNTGTVIMNGTVQMEYSSNLNYLSSQPNSSTNNSNMISWDYTGLAPMESKNIFVNFKIPASTNLGDSIFCSAIAFPVISDTTPQNNSDSLIQIITGSYDPNIKEVSPSVPVSISKVISDQYLTYTIHFQNTGNDTAFNIRISDCISSLLSKSSLRILSSSHPCRWSYDESGSLNIYFPDVNLPDSATNNIGSCGFVKFSIKININISTQDTIFNKADIYFDYNCPVATNTVKTYMYSDIIKDEQPPVINIDDGLIVFPNPSNGNIGFYFNIEIASEVSIKIYNITGSIVTTICNEQQPPGNYKKVFNAKEFGLSAGIYFVRLSVNGKSEVKKLVVVE